LNRIRIPAGDQGNRAGSFESEQYNTSSIIMPMTIQTHLSILPDITEKYRKIITPLKKIQMAVWMAFTIFSFRPGLIC
jgi:hypothetical protein